MGEIWSGYTRVGQHSFSTILVQGNKGNGATLVQGNYEYVTYHMLGLEDLYQENTCVMVMDSRGYVMDRVEEICNSDGEHSLFPLPIQHGNGWQVMFTSPVWHLTGFNQKEVKLSLIGEENKIRYTFKVYWLHHLQLDIPQSDV